MTAIQRTQGSQQDRFSQDGASLRPRQTPPCTRTALESAASKTTSAASASIPQANSKNSKNSSTTQGLIETIQTVLQTVQQVARLLSRILKTFNQKSPARTNTKINAQSLSAAATNSKLTHGFLWKPASDKDGKLAILLPPSLTGTVRSVSITSPTGEALETGAFAGTGNGDREHFRFGKSGAQYPDGSLVTVTFKDGSKTELPIKDTAARIER